VLQLCLADFVAQLQSPFATEELSAATGTPLVAVDLDGDQPGLLDHDRAGALAALVCVVVGVGEATSPGDGQLAQWCDLRVDGPAELAAIAATVAANPVASTALALLLRGGITRTIGEALAAESAVYSMLQAGPEFATWRAHRPRRPPRADEPTEAVRVERHDDCLRLTLARPQVHNAFNVALRDQLVDGLRIAQADPSIRLVQLGGDGPSFCSGGDLDEFGSFSDPASAHLVRLTRSAGRIVAALAPRFETYLHGAAMGAGIEVPAFGGRIVAHPDTRIALPELSLGLIPGAGGTVSLPRRIGAQRTAYLALSGAAIDAATALEWGLVDEVRDTELPNCL
jgi:enoyl-CoA hydratase/carnithine racemase